MSKSSKIPERKAEFVTSTPRPSQLPGLRSSFFSSNQSQLTSASLHNRSYGYSFSGSPLVSSDYKTEAKSKPTTRKFVKYKNNVKIFCIYFKTLIDQNTCDESAQEV